MQALFCPQTKSLSGNSLRSRGARAVRPCAFGYMVCCEPAALPLRGERLGGDQSSAHGALEVTMMGGGAGPTHQPLLRRRHAACTELACKRTRNLFLRWRVAPVVVCLAFRMDTRNKRMGQGAAATPRTMGGVAGESPRRCWGEGTQRQHRPPQTRGPTPA